MAWYIYFMSVVDSIRSGAGCGFFIMLTVCLICVVKHSFAMEPHESAHAKLSWRIAAIGALIFGVISILTPSARALSAIAATNIVMEKGQLGDTEKLAILQKFLQDSRDDTPVKNDKEKKVSD